MRFYYCLAAVLALLSLIFLNPIPATLAQSPIPTPKPRTISSPRALSPVAFFPLVFSNGITQTWVAKKGIPLTYDICSDVTAMNATWEYDWTNTPPACPGTEQIPMVATAADVNKPNVGNSNWVMGFNEPDISGLSFTDAAIYWHNNIEPNNPTKKLLSPAPSGSESGLTWLVNFRNAYIAFYATPPRLDGLAAHCYKWVVSQCTDYLQLFINQANAWGISEIWVTEFSFSPTPPSSPEGALQQQKEFTDWMVSQPMIKRYAWFASRINGNEPWSLPTHVTPLVDSGGQPTAYGTVYIPYQ